MRRRRLLWHLFPSYLLIIVVAVAAVSWYAGLSLRRFYYTQTTSTLEARASLLEERLGPLMGPNRRPELERLVADLSLRSGTRVTVILPSGQVAADSHEDPGAMENHADRPEIRTAMSGEVGRSRRFSHTLEKELVYVAAPVVRDGEVLGVVRTALPRTALDEELGAVLGRISLAAVVLILFAAAVSLVASRRLAGPIQAMRSAALSFARGDLKHHVPLPHSEELASLAESLNSMATDLDTRIRTITHQRAEQEAVLAGMVEGVIAVDSDERVIALNRAASEMFGVDPETARGRPIQEVIRNTDVHDFAALTLASDGVVEREFSLSAEQERFVQAHGAALRGDQGHRVGAVIVLNDVTRMRRLENVRRDFVANVSHELRTPITSIKGFVETLLDDADRDEESTRRFLSIISRHADRLDAIIEDLLFLSRIEHEGSERGGDFVETPVRGVIASAVESLSPGARERRTTVTVDCGEDIVARVNAQLLEHAVANVLDNAIKYSPEGEHVRVECERREGEVVIRVSDNGPGIPPADVPRIFERFYRVDKARSRELGGTGLGLAIAKHIAQAHDGRITVESVLGKGSSFSIRLPDVPAQQDDVV